MGIAGSALIIVTMLIRFFTIHKLPRWVFLAFWYVALVRLLVPYSLPSSFSIFAPLGKALPKTLSSSEAPSLEDVASVLPGATNVELPLSNVDPGSIVSYVAIPAQDGTSIAPGSQTSQILPTATTTTHMLDTATPEAESALFPDDGAAFGNIFASLTDLLQTTADAWTFAWIAGLILCAVIFALVYWRSHREFRESLPVDNAFVAEWISEQHLRRPLQVRSSDKITTPISYGILKPVILLPKSFDWSDRQGLVYVLTHECMHIRHFDTVTKLLIIAAVCLYWFNPLVWVMYVLANRDIEFATDAAVIRQCGSAARSQYALTLITMAAAKSNLAPLCNHFSKNVIEERITAIMTMKKTPWISLAVSAAMLTGTTMAFATTPQNGIEGDTSTSTPTVEATPMLVGDDESIVSYQITEGKDGMRVVALKDLATTDGSEPALVYSFNDGTNIVPVETSTAITIDQEPVWWTADEYEAWLEQEKKDLQECLGYKAWTSSKGWFTWTQDLIDEAVAQYEAVLDDIKSGAKVSKPFAVQTTEDGSVSATAILMESMPSAEAATTEGDNVALETDEATHYMVPSPGGATEAVSQDDAITFTYVTKTDAAQNGELVVEETSVVELQSDEVDLEAGLEPYRAFGLTYEWDQNSSDGLSLSMTWNNKQVHSLYDSQKGLWFANSMVGAYLDADAVDLEAVYQNGRLIGLKESDTAHNAADHKASLVTLSSASETADAIAVDDDTATEIGAFTFTDDVSEDVATATAEARELTEDEILSLRAQAKALEIFGEADALEMNVDSEGTPAYFKKFEPFDVSVEWVDGGLNIYYKSALVNAFVDDRPDGGYTTIGSKTPGGEFDVQAVYNTNGKLVGVEKVEHKAESHLR